MVTWWATTLRGCASDERIMSEPRVQRHHHASLALAVCFNELFDPGERGEGAAISVQSIIDAAAFISLLARTMSSESTASKNSSTLSPSHWHRRLPSP